MSRKECYCICFFNYFFLVGYNIKKILYLFVFASLLFQENMIFLKTHRYDQTRTIQFMWLNNAGFVPRQST